MRTKLFLFLVIVSALAYNADAKRYKFMTTRAGACPIRLYVNGNKYWIVSTSDKEVINLSGRNNEMSAIDAFGQHMRIDKHTNNDGSVTVYLGGTTGTWSNHGKRRLYEYRNGQVVELDYSSSSSSKTSSSSTSSNSSNYSDGSYHSNRSYDSDPGTRMATSVMGSVAENVITGGVVGALSGTNHNYPNIQFQVGASHIYAEFARLKFMIGGGGEGGGMGLAIYGGVGKEFIFKIKNENMLDDYVEHKRFPWHVGLGMFIITDDENSSDLTMGIAFTETPAVTNYAVMMDFTWSKYFGSSRRFGIFIGGGLGIGDTKDRKGKYQWDANVGVAFKLYQHK